MINTNPDLYPRTYDAKRRELAATLILRWRFLQIAARARGVDLKIDKQGWITATKTIRGHKVKWESRPSTKQGNGTGRFGGGWDFELGIQRGSNTTILNLGHSSIRIDRRKQATP